MVIELGDTVPLWMQLTSRKMAGMVFENGMDGPCQQANLRERETHSEEGLSEQPLIDLAPNDTAVLVYWGLVDASKIRRAWVLANISLTLLLTASRCISASAEPVNQVPYNREFLKHCCTFAHEVLSDFHPHAPRLREVDSWNVAPDIELDVATIEKNRVGMRYYRGVLGYYYDRLVRFGVIPRQRRRPGAIRYRLAHRT